MRRKSSTQAHDVAITVTHTFHVQVEAASADEARKRAAATYRAWQRFNGMLYADAASATYVVSNARVS